jgi:hypothetical protein
MASKHPPADPVTLGNMQVWSTRLIAFTGITLITLASCL